MSEHLRDQWRRTAVPTSWRPVVEGNHGNEHDCVILTQFVGRRRTYEVYTYGSAFGNYPSLSEAKAAVEEIYGGLSWTQVSIPLVEVTHYYFGPTTEFTDPTTMYVADLPRLGSRKVASESEGVIRRGLNWSLPGTPRGLELARKLLNHSISAGEIVREMEPLGIWWGRDEQYGGMSAYESHAETSDETIVKALAEMAEDEAFGMAMDRDHPDPDWGGGLNEWHKFVDRSRESRWFGTDVPIIFTAKTPVRDGEEWDPARHNPASGSSGNSYLHAGEALEVIEIRYDAGDGYHTLSVPQGIHTTARRKP